MTPEPAADEARNDLLKSVQSGALLRLAPVVLLLGGLLLSIGLAIGSRANIEEEGRLQFERRADRLGLEIQRRIRRPVFGLKGARGMYLASEKVTRQEFKAYVNSQELDREFPGVLGFGFVERVMRSELEAHLARERADEAPNYNVYPIVGDEVMYVLKHVVPLEPNSKAWGFDLGSEPRRREAIERAIRTGEPAMTARLKLVQDSDNRAGFLFMVPIYQRGAKPTTPEEREKSLLGLVDAPIVIENAFAGIGEQTENLLRFDVYEGPEAAPSEVLFDFDSHLNAITGLEESPANDGGRFRRTQEVNIGGRTWTVNIVSTGKFDGAIPNATPVLVGMGGLLLSGLLAAVAWALGHGREHALRLATAMTRDLAEAKARADAANQSKTEFLANMSHEIRTPLTSILGYTNLLREEGDISKAPPERVNALNTIQSAGEHLLTVINDILDLSKIEAGKITVEKVETPLVQLLAGIEGLMRPRAAAKGVSLHTEFCTPVPDCIISDPTRLRQILMNLIGNAAKFTTKGAIDVRVYVNTTDTGGRLRFEIKDTGPGMTPAQTRALFTPFTQADTSVTRRHGGTGLGLSISRRLAEIMGGDVKLESSEPGVGSLFSLELPFVEAPGARLVHESCVTRTAQVDGDDRAESTLPAVPLSVEGRFLLAEDNAVNQRLILFHLKKAGAQVDLTENGREALEMILAADAAGKSYHLLLTDMQMPEMDGYTLARTLRDRANDIPIIALTAHAMAEDRQKCIDAGCNDYVTKPIDRVTLIETCRRWVYANGA
jgi:signal transduction histidine kinase